MTSIIETAYGEGVAAMLCARISALDEATAAYQTTGNAQRSAAQSRDLAKRAVIGREDSIGRSNRDTIKAGKSEGERKEIRASLLDRDPLLNDMRDEHARAERAHDEAERAHKNAYHLMESLRVAIGGYAAVLGATKD